MTFYRWMALLSLGVALTCLLFLGGKIWTEDAEDFSVPLQEQNIAHGEVEPKAPELELKSVEVPVSSHESPGVLRLAESSLTFTAALELAGELYGLDDPRYFELVTMAERFCGQEFDLYEGLSSDSFDQSRAWAIARLNSLCDELDPADLSVSSDSLNLGELRRDLGEDAAVEAARDLVGSAPDLATIEYAGHFLLERDLIPSTQALGPEPSLADRLRAWMTAVQYVRCAESGGCGPDSPVTAFHCALHGCSPGANYQMALQQNLSQRELALVTWYALWLGRQRGGG
jgi:hypothetical protein